MICEPDISAAVAADFDAHAAHDAAACAACLANDAFELSPWRAPMQGQKAIEEAHVDWFSEGETDKRCVIRPTRMEGALAGVLVSSSARIPSGARVHGASLNALMGQAVERCLITHSSLTEIADPDAGIALTPH